MIPKIVIPDDAPPVMSTSRAYQGLLERAPVSYYDTLPGSEGKLIERIADGEIVINIRASSRFSERVFSSSPRLRLISIWGTGTDNVDLAAAARHGVTVTNTPGVAAVAIAEHALGLLLAVARRLPQIDAEMRRGGWPRGEVTLLHGKILGILGLGAVGRQFARLGSAIGMRVIAWTMHPNPALGFELVSLDTLLTTADVVSLHLRLSPESSGFMGERQFRMMKPSAILINTARGALVDEEALSAALSAQRIAGAGLDVFDIEPLPQGHRLTRLDNVVLTPHAAGIAPEVLEVGLALAVENVWNYLNGTPTNVVTPPASR
ncbi:MAG: glycerate dehydrogenase [Acidobacteria bacterium]|nr:MAG: glycerate dehydrogenase [Acidobacteriota bacterium]